MTKLLSLIRVSLRANFGLSVLRYRIFTEKRDRWMIPLIGLAVLGLGPTLYGYLKLIEVLYGMLVVIGQQSAILTFGILSGQILILIFGLFYVISSFYFSRDLEILIPLPLKPFQVMLSKFAVILVNEYLTVAAFVLPVFIYYGILAKAGLPYWANALLVYLLLPVIPLAIVALLSIGMMRIVNISRKKDALIIAGSLTLIASGLAFQFVLSRSAGSGINAQALTDLFASPDSLLTRIGAKFPPSIWATKALAGGWSANGILNLLVLSGVSFVFFIGILALSEKTFYRGLIGIGEISSRRKALSALEISRKISSGRRPIRAIFRREVRIMNRTPIFLLNGVLTVVLIPLVFFIMAKAGSRDASLVALLGAFSSGNASITALVVAGFMTLCGTINGTASSAFSREGGQFWISKAIPVAPKDQVIAKFFHSYMIALLGILAAALVCLRAFHVNISALAPAAALALAASVFLVVIGMIIDLARPLLDWINPMKAIKQNLNVLFATIADMGILVSLGFAAARLLKAGIPGRSLLFVLFAVLCVFAAGSFLLLLKFAEKRYREIEV
jgi:ABC-2 type transport system permease protein